MTAALTAAYGNPNSVDHAAGAYAERLVDDARVPVSALVGALPHHVVFTSGATESLALALAHAHDAKGHSGPLRVAAMPVEHRALLDLLVEGRRAGRCEVRWLRVDRAARLDLDDLESAIRAQSFDVVCVMGANNEVGTVYPIEDVARIARSGGADVLVDATQSAGREQIMASEWAISYLAMSAHKMYGPKGVGALVTTVASPPRRSGTPNVPGIVGFAEAARLRVLEMQKDERQIRVLRDYLQALLVDRISGLQVNGDVLRRLSATLHVSIPDVPNDAVTAWLHDRVAISTGAACSSGAQAPSHVLQAMGLPRDAQDGALRISCGKFTTREEIDRAADLLCQAISETRTALRGAPIATEHRVQP